MSKLPEDVAWGGFKCVASRVLWTPGGCVVMSLCGLRSDSA